MGFFSWDCPCCQHSIREHGSVTDKSRWLSKAVAVFESGNIATGTYDGYGRLLETGAHLEGGFTLYHQACWKLLGKPDYSGESRGARDQGLGSGRINPGEPKSLAECGTLKRRAAKRLEAERKRWEEYKARSRRELVAKGQPIPTWLA